MFKHWRGYNAPLLDVTKVVAEAPVSNMMHKNFSFISDAAASIAAASTSGVSSITSDAPKSTFDLVAENTSMAMIQTSWDDIEDAYYLYASHTRKDSLAAYTSFKKKLDKITWKEYTGPEWMRKSSRKSMNMQVQNYESDLVIAAVARFVLFNDPLIINLPGEIVNIKGADGRSFTACDPGSFKQIQIHRSCNGCGAEEGVPLTACGKCLNTAYCSKKCQVEHWKKGHSAVCAKH